MYKETRLGSAGIAVTRDDIAIIGVMGSGKSTIGALLAKKLRYKFFEESFATCPTLAKYYADPRRYAVETELWFMREKAMQHIDISKYMGGTVQDSPIQSTVGIFIPAMYSEGILSGHSMTLLNDIYESFMAAVVPKPTQFVYLDVPSEVLVKRVRSRGRVFESKCDLDYLAASVTAANNFISFAEGRGFVSPLMIVDGTGTPDQIVDEIVQRLTVKTDGSV